MDLATEGVADLIASMAKLRANGAQLVVGLQKAELADVAIKSSSPQLAPIGTKGAISKLHDRLEGESERSVAMSDL